MEETLTLWVRKVIDTQCISTKYAHIEISFMHRHADGTVRNRSHHWESPKSRYFDSLYITCQMDDYNKAPYAFDLEYRGYYHVKLDKADMMVKTLKGIERKLDKLRDEYGNVTTFSEHAIRIFRVVKADSFCFSIGNETSNLKEGEYAFINNVQEVQYKIDRMIEDCQEALTD